MSEDLVNDIKDALTPINDPHMGISIVEMGIVQNIAVDGDQADMTDGAALTVRNLDAGDHMVRAECGRRSAEMLVTIKGEETSEITLDATKK